MYTSTSTSKMHMTFTHLKQRGSFEPTKWLGVLVLQKPRGLSARKKKKVRDNFVNFSEPMVGSAKLNTSKY